jgi:hypothetical protein
VFDKATSQDIVQLVWETARKERPKSIHAFCGLAVENILKLAIARKSADNVTAVMVAFEGLKKALDKLEAPGMAYSTLSQDKRKEDWARPSRIVQANR